MAKKDSETSGAERGAVEVADGPLLDLCLLYTSRCV